jgi:hypothetical protein
MQSRQRTIDNDVRQQAQAQASASVTRTATERAETPG